MTAPEIDIDALLAAAATVCEPRADELLWRIAYGDGSAHIESIPEAAFEPWHRYRDWRDAPGHRQLCPKCNRVFIRDRHRGRRCPQCRKQFRRTCLECGLVFVAVHYITSRCPPCQNKPQGLEAERRSCGRCGEPFVPGSWNAMYCSECR